MNIKRATNSQLSTTESKKQTKQTSRTGTESQIWRSFGGSSEGEWGEKVQGIRSINGRYKIDRGMLRIVQEMEKPKNSYARPMDMSQGGCGVGGTARRKGSTGQGRAKGENWDNCSSIINKIYLKKRKTWILDIWVASNSFRPKRTHSLSSYPY